MLLKFIFKKKKIQRSTKKKIDINNWMDLTKEERFDIDTKEKHESMRKKKVLLKSIRDEYNKIKKINN